MAGTGKCDPRVVDRFVICQEVDGSDEVRVSELVVVAVRVFNALEEIAGAPEEYLKNGVAALAFVEHDALLLAPVAGGGDDGRELARRRAAADG